RGFGEHTGDLRRESLVDVVAIDPVADLETTRANAIMESGATDHSLLIGREHRVDPVPTGGKVVGESGHASLRLFEGRLLTGRPRNPWLEVILVVVDRGLEDRTICGVP